MNEHLLALAEKGGEGLLQSPAPSMPDIFGISA